MVLYLLACGPLLLTLGGWINLYRTRKQGWPRPIALIALAATTVTAAYAATVILYYTFRPPLSYLPPWKDPEILDSGLLFLMAPIGLILGLVTAGKRAGPRWLILIVEIASLPLLFLGVMASTAV